MLLNRTPVLIVFIMCLGTVYMLFNIKNNVMMIRSELAEVQKQMRYEADTIHVLKAELSYLSSPERLNRLNGQYLKLTDTKVAQMIQDPVQDKVEYKTLSLSGVKSASSNSNWRYKKGPSKYVTLVSGKK
jgi:hypothetical protein